MLHLKSISQFRSAALPAISGSLIGKKSEMKPLFPAAILVCAVTAVPAVCGGKQSWGPCFAPAYPAGAATGLSKPGPPEVPQSCTTAQKQGKPQSLFFKGMLYFYQTVATVPECRLCCQNNCFSG